ncbi:MAG: TRAP transporter small permease [Spirochaetia bacterium]|nr:TRAP transporter small permease [Spirochaetia bacterium]MCF7942622.1 TRAP transporter small permease [Spirochaetia bacterium]
MKIIRWLDDYFEAVILVFTLFSMSIIITVQVFFRYVLLNSISWSEEIARYLFIYMVYFGISYAVRKNRHIKIEVLINVLPVTGKKVISIISDLLFLVFASVVTYQAFSVVGTLDRLGQVAGITGLPMSLIYSGVPIGYGLVCIRLVQNLYHKLTNLSSPYEQFVYRGDRSSYGSHEDHGQAASLKQAE